MLSSIPSRVTGVLLAVLVATPLAAQQVENKFARRVAAEIMPAPLPDEQGPISAAGRFTSLFQVDNIVTPGPTYTPFSNLYTEGELRGSVGVTKWFTVTGLLRLEQTRDEQTGGAFRDQALFVQRLFGAINLASVILYGGKIHPRFGTAWYATPGLYGSDFAEDYELDEKLGFGARLDMHAGANHKFSFEVFQTDTSFLTANFLPGPDAGDPSTLRQARKSLEQGGPSNTGTFESFATTINSRDYPGLPGLTTDFGLAKRKASSLDVRDEYSWVAGATWRFALTDGIGLQPIAEFASVHGQGGLDRDADYLTLAANLYLDDRWEIAVHSSQRKIRDRGLNEYFDDLLLGAAVAYNWSSFKDRLPWLNGVSTIAGYRHDRLNAVDRDTVGFQIRYEREL